MSEAPGKPMIVIVWLLVAAVILIGGYKLFTLHDHHSPDQKILIRKSNR